MAADLFDLKRLKVTAETRAMLQAKAMRTGKSQQEIARDLLHGIALEELDAARVLYALDPREARGGDAEGHSRDGGGRQGGRR